MSSRAPSRVGLIGFGAIGADVADMLNEFEKRRAQPTNKVNAVVSAVLVRRKDGRSERELRILDECRAALRGSNAKAEDTADNSRSSDFLFTDDPAEFFADASFSLAVEVAGQEALRTYGKQALQSKKHLLATSIGAFTDDALFEELAAVAAENGTQLALASGAMPALDWMGAASLLTDAHGGEERVKVTSQKPPQSWRGTPAEEQFPRLVRGELSEEEVAKQFGSAGGGQPSKPAVLFSGTAREASAKYPKNANVATALALATAGLDATVVDLVTNPLEPEKMGYTLEYESSVAGRIKVELESKPNPQNPKTGVIVAPAVVKAIRNMLAPVGLGL